MILLVRHAAAGERWEDDDDLRPLTERGKQQAHALVEHLTHYGFSRVVSSPSVRCVDTVAPLAASRGKKVKTSKSLAEGAGGQALDFVLDVVDDVVLCTHGDVVEEVLDGLRSVGWAVPLDAPAAKGSTWVLAERTATYLPPPA